VRHLQANKQRGFTLLESLIVLSIVSIMSMVLLINITTIHKQKTIETFLNTLHDDLLFSQQYALVNGKTVIILFSESEKKYYVTHSLGVKILARSYPSSISIEGATLENRVIYNNFGSISKSGTILVKHAKDTYRLVVYLGKGRVKIEKI